ncbi:unnamed protein product [Caenorhabditis nigoni]
MQEVNGYRININDLFDSSPKTEDVHNNSSMEYEYPSTEGNGEEGIYEYITEISKPSLFFKKYYFRLLAVIILAGLIAISIILCLVWPKIFHHTVTTPTTSRTASDSTPTYTTTKIPTTTTTRISTQTSQTTYTDHGKTTVTSRPSTRTTHSTHADGTSCASTDYPSTFLFAYSNDFSSETVSDTWDKFTHYRNYYSWYGSVRFDTEHLDIQFHKDIKDVTSTIEGNLPNPIYGFSNSSIGSNVFDVFEIFFSNTVAPVCGSIIVVLLKRYPNETDISRIVSLIRFHHAIVHVITSTTPSGGSQSKTMYSVASKTNGMGAFQHDEHFGDAIYTLPLYEPPYPIYATTIQVSGAGTKTLPDFYPSRTDDYLIEITYQDHVPDDSFQMLNLRWTNVGDSGSYNVYSENVSYKWHGGTLTSGWGSFHGVNYSISLVYNYYLGQDVQNLQIRIYSKT